MIILLTAPYCCSELNGAHALTENLEISMIVKVITPPDKLDEVRLAELEVAARSVKARLDCVVGDGQTIHDCRVHVAYMVNRIQALKRDGEVVYSNGWTSSLDNLEATIERCRKWASLHGA